MTVILLHVAALAVTLEMRIEVRIAGAVGIRAVGPLRVGALDRERTHPLPQRILDRKRIGHIVASRAHFRAHGHGLIVSLVFYRIHVLVRNVLAEYCAGVEIGRAGWSVGCQRSKSLRKANRMW